MTVIEAVQLALKHARVGREDWAESDVRSVIEDWEAAAIQEAYELGKADASKPE